LIFLSPTLSSRSIFNEALTKLPESRRVVEIQAVDGLDNALSCSPNRAPDG